MSNLEEHMDEQDRITAACEAGVCGHPECHEDEDKGDDSYDNEIVAGFAPRWAWNIIDELLKLKLANDQPISREDLTDWAKGVEIMIDLKELLRVYVSGEHHNETRGQALATIREAQRWLDR